MVRARRPAHARRGARGAGAALWLRRRAGRAGAGEGRRPARAARCPAHAAASRALGVGGAAARAGGARGRAPARPALPRGARERLARRRRRAVRDDHAARVAARRRARATPTSCACARATPTGRRTRSSCPATPARCGAVAARRAPRPAWRWCRSAADERRRRRGAAARRLRGGGLRSTSGALPALTRSTSARSSPCSGRACAARRSSGALGERGYTLGHFPQSWEYVTLGGCVATRSAGQASTGYGRIDEMVRRPAAGGARRRARRCRRVPATRPGRTCASSLVGLGGDARRDHRGGAARCARARRERRYEGWSVRVLRGRAPRRFRALEQEHARPTSRGSPTRPRRAVDRAGGPEGWPAALARATCGCAATGGCLAIVGLEGGERDVERRRGAPRRACSAQRRRRARPRAGRGVEARALRRRPTCATTCSTTA